MNAALLSKPVERLIRRSTHATSLVDVDSLQQVWGGNGEVLRVTLQGAGVESVIVKHIVPPPGFKKKMRRDLGLRRTIESYDNELCFYREFAQSLPEVGRAPRFFGGNRLEECWVFVLEDLKEEELSPLGRDVASEPLRAALTWLAHFHAAFLGRSTEGLWKEGSYWNLASRATELGKMTHGRLKGAAEALDQALNRCQYRTLIHGDAKLDNFCFSESGERAVGVDFQHTGQGCGMKDVMCLLDSALLPHEIAVQGEGLVDLYFDELRTSAQERGISGEMNALEDEWRCLYPVAWADYYRFLDGWAPGKYPPEGPIAIFIESALSYLSRGGR